jgi:hypothetical protein
MSGCGQGPRAGLAFLVARVVELADTPDLGFEKRRFQRVLMSFTKYRVYIDFIGSTSLLTPKHKAFT